MLVLHSIILALSLSFMRGAKANSSYFSRYFARELHMRLVQKELNFLQMELCKKVAKEIEKVNPDPAFIKRKMQVTEFGFVSMTWKQSNQKRCHSNESPKVTRHRKSTDDCFAH